jgi:hypothetical protein
LKVSTAAFILTRYHPHDTAIAKSSYNASHIISTSQYFIKPNYVPVQSYISQPGTASLHIEIRNLKPLHSLASSNLSDVSYKNDILIQQYSSHSSRQHINHDDYSINYRLMHK